MAKCTCGVASTIEAYTSGFETGECQWCSLETAERHDLMNLPLQELCVVILFDWFHAPLRCLSQNVRCFKVWINVVSASIIASIFEGRHKAQGSKNQTSKQESVYLLFFHWSSHNHFISFLWTGEVFRFIAIALYCPCASQQRIDEIYDFLAENASRPPVWPLTQNFTWPGHSTNQ